MARYEQLTLTELTMPTVTSPNAGSLFSVTLTPASVAAATIAKQTFTVPGLKLTDTALPLSNPAANSVGITAAEISAVDTLRLTFVNPTAGALVPTTGAYSFLLIRGA